MPGSLVAGDQLNSSSSSREIPPGVESKVTAADRILLISTRALGTRCDAPLMAEGLHCEELVYEKYGAGRWRSIAWAELAAEPAEPQTTIIYVHGNRIASGEDKSHGMAMYRSLNARKHGDAPLRFIIWSWPSAQIPGVIKDYQVKAARTRPVAWQLAWAIDQMPAETPLALVGYSYGARVVTGALHLLAGGELSGLALVDRPSASRPPIRAALLAAAVDASWIRPGGYHGRALEQVDQLLLVNNHRDPAMRFYHLAFHGRMRPLGFEGPQDLAGGGELAGRIHSVDVTDAVGRSHALSDYLAASGRVGHVLEQVVATPPLHREFAKPANAELAGRRSDRQ
jgi:hypothetical protein